MATQNVLMPQMGESIQEGTLTRWHKKVGDKVQREEELFEISTDKVDTVIPSPVSGVLVQIFAKENDVVNVNSVVAVIDDAAQPGSVVAQAPVAATAAQTPKVVPPPTASQSTPVQESAKVLASPLARKVAEEHSVDLSKLQGSGEGNKIVKNDVLAALESGKSVSPLVAAAAAAATAPVAKAPSDHVKSTGGSSEGVIDGVRVSRVPMTGMRKKIADHMVMSKKTSPHVTSVIEIDLQKVVDVRAKFKDKFEAINGFKLTFMPFFLQAVVEAIKAVPVVNSSVDGDAILYKKDINLGCAVALDWGLIVPVIKNSSERSFVGLGRELNNLAEKARNKKLSPDDVRGGSFSISNYGGFGTVIGQPIINQPQVAIFGIGAMQKKPVVINDAIAIRTMCYCVLSFDHRVIDGSDSGKFLSTVKNVLENWNIPVI
ncbi:dihydrolipoamide acetyltransferase family protein [Fluviispira multicolorata]|uniref:Dihydrolipoamide acetyltransferase component of pyruvate dehydrogenase complex n=1 Tax=Fluviispira multicolorata TaxID=2654512 RepID=A0A833JI07_9BACT|nr:dihydrolipoamide acetyltransferase family protein [Fluviispira multicolorata]KAB8033793.1 2-oxoglutarate dehydrogenase, E2 component, dihydrolipoamide succinyltransferase [Fluviispira multicolorata]